MAGSRNEKLGSIFTRTCGLLRSGALKKEDTPLWYDVYKAFPPKYEPSYSRPVINKEIIPILYTEDTIRGQFFRKYGSPGLIDIRNAKTKLLCERFVEKYHELEKRQETENITDLFKATEESITAEGIILNRHQQSPAHSATSEDHETPSDRRILETIKINLTTQFRNNIEQSDIQEKAE